MSVIDTLIYDRTADDVRHVYEIKGKILRGEASSAEIAEYNDAAMKGAYNYTDMNRVGNAALYVSDALIDLYDDLSAYREAMNVDADDLFVTPYNRDAVEVVGKHDWESLVRVDYDAAVQYLEDIRILRAALSLPDTAPAVPSSLSGLTYRLANDIERLLFIIYATELVKRDELFDNVLLAHNSFIYSGEICCGE